MDKTLLKGLQVLEYVVAQTGPVRSIQLASDLGLVRSNAHRVLKTLEHAGYITKDPDTRHFRASLKLWEMGSEIINRLDLRQCTAPFLQALAHETGESVHLSMLDGVEVVYIDKIDSPQPIGAYTRTGGRAPAYCVATGKALLAERTEDELRPVLKNLKAYSSHTITQPKALISDLYDTRERGYSINKGEWRDTVWGFAAVIRDYRNTPIAAVGVSGPEFRLSSSENIVKMGTTVRKYALKISHVLGSRNAE